MDQRIPFDPYDFFGYLASGLLVVVGMDLTLGVPHVLGRDLKLVDLAVLLLAAYIGGQLVATPARALLEDLLVGRGLGRPNVNLFAEKRPLLRGLLFPGFYKPLPEPIRSRVLKKASAEGIKDTGEGLFLHVRYLPEILSNDALMERLNSFINKYGFARNLAFTSLVVGATLYFKGRWIVSAELVNYGTVTLITGLLLFYRYLKFFRQYSYELFNAYGGMK